MAKKFQISRKILENEKDARMYFTRTRLCDQPMVVEAGTEQSCPNTLVGALLEIDGIAAVELHMYHVAVHKSPMYDWDEIEPRMLRLLSAMHSDLQEMLDEKENA